MGTARSPLPIPPPGSRTPRPAGARLARLGLIAWAALAGACGDLWGERADAWDEPAQFPMTSIGLSGAVAVLDPSLDRLMMLRAAAPGSLASSFLPLGENPVTTVASADASTLFVLSRGVVPQRDANDQPPRLTVYDGGAAPGVRHLFPLSDALQGLAIDPAGRWAVVYDAGGILVNPNELIFVDLENPDQGAVPRTIRSHGSAPERLTFTDPLLVPGRGVTRFLVVETTNEVTLIDLGRVGAASADLGEVTIQLPQATNGSAGRPAQVVFHGGGTPDDEASANDARLAVRLASDSNVMLVELTEAPAGSGRDFSVTINVADVGAFPSSIEFVSTDGAAADGGVRLAALVPGRSEAVLVDPATTLTQTVRLPRGFTHMTRVTRDLGGGRETALLYSPSVTGVAFWSIDNAGSSFFSVDDRELGIRVREVREVPGRALRILEGEAADEFYVLDLETRESFPILTELGTFQLQVAPDGGRVWALSVGTGYLGSLDLTDLHPYPLLLERPVAAIHEIRRADGGYAAVALHASLSGSGGASLAATVLDASAPSTRVTSYHGGLLLGGLQ
ncbi:MAG: hypothetical protein IT376_00225 [Polyangiaceae bacterium]|nr:hypothetical protein [Polyangiaceae bacterium]